MTIDSFNKEDNVIRQSTARLQGATPLFLVQASRPVLILDEPQNMESEARIRALASLHPLMALRYSATHRQPVQPGLSADAVRSIPAVVGEKDRSGVRG
jgi:type III restriction enzyme